MTNRSNQEPGDRVPALLVERLALGELDASEAAAVRRRLAEAGEEGRLEALARSDDAIREAYPPAEMAAAIARRAGGLSNRSVLFDRSDPSDLADPSAPLAAAPWWRSPWALALPAVVVAALIVALLPAAPPAPSPLGVPTGGSGAPGETGLRAKGLLPHLQVYRQRAGREEQLRDGAPAKAADLIQLKIVAAAARYAAIVSIDGRGAVTRHFPEAGDRAGALGGDGAEPLPHAYELDDAPAFERFVLVSGDRPFAVGAVEAAARALAADADRARVGPLALPEGLKQSSFTLTKAATP